MSNKLSIPLVLSILALVVAGLAYLSPTQVAKSGEAACPALKEARDNLFAKNPNHQGLIGLDRAIANNCPDVGDANCGQEVGLEGFPSQCYTDDVSCTAAGAFACFESVTCTTLTGGTQITCGVSL